MSFFFLLHILFSFSFFCSSQSLYSKKKNARSSSQIRIFYVAIRTDAVHTCLCVWMRDCAFPSAVNNTNDQIGIVQVMGGIFLYIKAFDCKCECFFFFFEWGSSVLVYMVTTGARTEHSFRKLLSDFSVLKLQFSPQLSLLYSHWKRHGQRGHLPGPWLKEQDAENRLFHVSMCALVLFLCRTKNNTI